MSSNIEAGTQQQNHHHHLNNHQNKAMMKTTLLIFNAIILSIGNTAGPLLIRLYFLHGGKRKWLSSWLVTGGWPIILVPLSISYIHRRRRRSKEGDGASAKVFLIKPGLFTACVVLGLLTGLDDYMYAYGSSLLPVSTSALLLSSHLAFQAGFALLIVKHKFTPFSINAVVLLTVGALILGLHTNGDRPANESQKEHFVGFFMMLGVAALYGCVLPLIELAYMKAKQAITYTLVMEVQLVIGFFATAFCTVGMLVNNDFKMAIIEIHLLSSGPVQEGQKKTHPNSKVTTFFLQKRLAFCLTWNLADANAHSHMVVVGRHVLSTSPVHFVGPSVALCGPNRA